MSGHSSPILFKEVINLSDSLPFDAARFVDCVKQLADEYLGQPIAIFANDDGELMIGVMSLLDPTDDDWCLKPINVPEAIEMMTAPGV